MKNVFVLLILTTTAVSAQKTFKITGQLTDSLNAPLPSATVMLLNDRDSSLVNFTLSDAQGVFTFRNIERKGYLLQVSFVGHKSYLEKINGEEGDVDVGKITLEPMVKELGVVEIVAEKPPVIIKKDTIEFNASSFKTQENALVEDLLKKLPGIEIDNDGNITAQGEQVKNVTVDGKKFFGSDPKIATKNLPADAIDKVQVFDKLSDQATFTGIDDGEREKTINLELKEEKRNAMFGTLVAGGGTDDRFQGRASVNKFTKDRQISFLGMANNTNDRGFGIDDYMNFTGGSRQMMRGGTMRMQVNSDNSSGVPLDLGNQANGIMETYAGGVNLNDQLSRNTAVNGSYFYNYLNHGLDQTTLRENFLTSGNFRFDENKTENNTNSNHRANVTLDHDIDSVNILKFNGSFSVNETTSEQQSSSTTTTTDGTVANENERQYASGGVRTNFNSNLLYRHKFEKRGRSISTNMIFSKNQNESNGLLDAVNTFYGEQDSVEHLKQSNDQTTDAWTYGATVSYTEPIGNRKYLEVNYNYRHNTNEVERNVFDITNGESIFDQSLSNRYSSDYQYQRAGINFRIVQTAYNLVVGSSFQQSRLAGSMELHNTEISNTYRNVLPAVRFNYDFSNTRHLRFDYEANVQEPSIQQLQPVVDNSDPLNIYIGNQDLRPAYSQAWRLNYMMFNPVTFMNFFAFVDIEHTRNAIVNSQQIDERFVRTIIPVNVDGTLSIRGNVNVGIPLTKLSSRLNVSGNVRHSNSMALLNEQENDIVSQSAGGTLRYTYEYKELFDVTLAGSLTRQQTDYEFDQPDQTYFNSTYSMETNLSFLRNYSFNTNFDYLVYRNSSANFYQKIPLLNLSISRFVLKNKSGEIKLSVNNLLDRALGIDQTSNINYIEQVTTNSLGRYFMISFTYALNKGLNPMSARRGGGQMIRMKR